VSVDELEAEDFAHHGAHDHTRFAALGVLEIQVGIESEHLAQVGLHVVAHGVVELVAHKIQELAILDDRGVLAQDQVEVHAEVPECEE